MSNPNAETPVASRKPPLGFVRAAVLAALALLATGPAGAGRNRSCIPGGTSCFAGEDGPGYIIVGDSHLTVGDDGSIGTSPDVGFLSHCERSGVKITDYIGGRKVWLGEKPCGCELAKLEACPPQCSAGVLPALVAAGTPQCELDDPVCNDGVFIGDISGTGPIPLTLHIVFSRQYAQSPALSMKVARVGANPVEVVTRTWQGPTLSPSPIDWTFSLSGPGAYRVAARVDDVVTCLDNKRLAGEGETYHLQVDVCAGAPSADLRPLGLGTETGCLR